MPASVPPTASAVRFADAARRLQQACRASGLTMPAFRSPPGDPAAVRTIRRRPDGGAVVAVRVRGRTLAAVVADMVDGVVAANGLTGTQAEEARHRLVGEIEAELSAPARAA